MQLEVPVVMILLYLAPLLVTATNSSCIEKENRNLVLIETDNSNGMPYALHARGAHAVTWRKIKAINEFGVFALNRAFRVSDGDDNLIPHHNFTSRSSKHLGITENGTLTLEAKSTTTFIVPRTPWTKCEPYPFRLCAVKKTSTGDVKFLVRAGFQSMRLQEVESKCCTNPLASGPGVDCCRVLDAMSKSNAKFRMRFLGEACKASQTKINRNVCKKFVEC